MSLCAPLFRLPNALVDLLGCLLAATLAACGGGAPIPPPPSPDLAQLDPELRGAVEAARARVLADPHDLGAWGELAMVLEANELDGPAEEAWTYVVTVAEPDARWWYSLARVRERRGDVPGALAALERTLALADDYAPAHGRRGRLLLEAGRLDEAEAALARALALDDRLSSAALGMARLQLLRGEPERAVTTLAPVLARFPREPYVNGLLARAFTALGDAARAEQHLRAEEQAGAPTANDPWLAEVQRRACGRRVRLERVKTRLFAGDAAAAWEELAPLEGESDDPLVLGMQCQVLLALGRPEDALARLDRAGPRAETSSFLVLDRALALRALGETERALAALDAGLARDPAHTSGHALRGELLFDLGRFAEAVPALEEARTRGGWSLATALTLARARANAGDLEGGIRDLEAAAESFPAAPKPWAYRSELLALAGRDADARASLEEARRRGLEPELAERVRARLDEIAERAGPANGGGGR